MATPVELFWPLRSDRSQPAAEANFASNHPGVFAQWPNWLYYFRQVSIPAAPHTFYNAHILPIYNPQQQHPAIAHTTPGDTLGVIEFSGALITTPNLAHLPSWEGGNAFVRFQVFARHEYQHVMDTITYTATGKNRSISMGDVVTDDDWPVYSPESIEIARVHHTVDLDGDGLPLPQSCDLNNDGSITGGVFESQVSRSCTGDVISPAGMSINFDGVVSAPPASTPFAPQSWPVDEFLTNLFAHDGDSLPDWADHPRLPQLNAETLPNKQAAAIKSYLQSHPQVQQDYDWSCEGVNHASR